MKPVQEIQAAISRRLLSKCQSVIAGRKKLEALAPQYYLYLDNRKQVKDDWKRIIYMVRLLGADRVGAIEEKDKSGILAEIAANPAQSDGPGVPLPIWKAMREYLREAGESRIEDIRVFLQWLGYPNVTRQAVESAIARHKQDFGSRTKGHERLIWAKEKEDEGSSSSDDS